MDGITRLIFLASNNGSAMRAVARAIETNDLKARIELVISNKENAAALAFARTKNIAAAHIADDKTLTQTIKNTTAHIAYGGELTQAIKNTAEQIAYGGGLTQAIKNTAEQIAYGGGLTQAIKNTTEQIACGGGGLTQAIKNTTEQIACGGRGLTQAIKNTTEQIACGGGLTQAIKNAQPDLIILSGYLKKIPASLLTENSAPILNIHPSLLPQFGGKGMFGLNVHKAVLAAGVKETGATIHYVNENYDDGKIIAQERLAVKAKDNAESLAARVMAAEEKLLLETLRKIKRYIQEGLSTRQAIEKISA